MRRLGFDSEFFRIGSSGTEGAEQIEEGQLEQGEAEENSAGEQDASADDWDREEYPEERIHRQQAAERESGGIYRSERFVRSWSDQGVGHRIFWGFGIGLDPVIAKPLYAGG